MPSFSAERVYNITPKISEKSLFHVWNKEDCGQCMFVPAFHASQSSISYREFHIAKT